MAEIELILPQISSAFHPAGTQATIWVWLLDHAHANDCDHSLGLSPARHCPRLRVRVSLHLARWTQRFRLTQNPHDVRCPSLRRRALYSSAQNVSRNLLLKGSLRKSTLQKPTASLTRPRSHSQSHKVFCSIDGCSSSFTKRRELQRHLHTLHSPTLRYVCRCGYRTARKDHYRRHVTRNPGRRKGKRECGTEVT